MTSETQPTSDPTNDRAGTLRWPTLALLCLTALLLLAWVTSYAIPGMIFKIGHEPDAIAVQHAHGFVIVAGELFLWDLILRVRSPLVVGVYWTDKKMIVVRYAAVIVPLLLVDAFLVYPILRRWRRPPLGCCRACGYDLRAHRPGQICPECGVVVPA
jgi:hypothetical protein